MFKFLIFLPLLLVSTTLAFEPVIKKSKTTHIEDWFTDWSSNIVAGDCSLSNNTLVYEETVNTHGRLLLPRRITKSFSNSQPITCIQVTNHRDDGLAGITKGGVGKKSVKIVLKSTGVLVHALHFDIKIYAEEETTTTTEATIETTNPTTVTQDPTEWSSNITAGDCSSSNNELVYDKTVNKHGRLLLPRLITKSFSNSKTITCIQVINHRTDGKTRISKGGVGEKSVKILLKSTGTVFHALHFDIKIYVEGETTTITTTEATTIKTEPTTVKDEEETTTTTTEGTTEKTTSTSSVDTTTTSKAEVEITTPIAETTTKILNPTTVTTTTTAKPKEEITTTTVSFTEPTKLTTVISTTPEDMEDICKENPEDSYLWPHPTDCTRFISCDNNVMHIMPCPSDMWFSKKESVCVRPAESDCPYENGSA